MALPYKKGVLVPDLGSDIVFYFHVSNDGELSEICRVSLMPGDGPRHAVQHPNTDTAYVVNEISLSVVVLRPNPMGARMEMLVSDRKDLLSEPPILERVKAAAIRVSEDGKFLYISVRYPLGNFGKIVAFSLDPLTGDITEKLGEWSSHGAHPRDFYVIEEVMYEGECSSFLAIANRDTDNIVLVQRDMVTGLLMDEPIANMTINSPTSILEYS